MVAEPGSCCGVHILMSVSEEAAAAFRAFRSRLKSLEDTVQDSVESGISGVSTRLALMEQLVNTSGALSEGCETRRSKIACSNGCCDIPIFGGEYEEYEDWQYKVRVFLNSECSLFKTRYLEEHLERKFGARPHGVTPAAPGADSAHAQDVQDKTSGSSNSMLPPRSDEPGSDECAAPMAKRSWVNDTDNNPGEFPIPAAHSGQVLAASGYPSHKI